MSQTRARFRALHHAERGFIRRILDAVERPLNVLLLPGGPSARALLDAGVRRISLGSALSLTANAALVEAGRELLAQGTHGFWDRAAGSAAAIRAAFTSDD